MTPRRVRALVAGRIDGFEPIGDLVPLTGGALNHVWRLNGRPGPVIVKHAPPFVASAPHIPLDPSRVDIEATALAALAPGGSLDGVASTGVRPPRLLHHDPDHHVIVMEDVGPVAHLGTWLRTAEDAGTVGTDLGAFIGRLHRQSAHRDDLRAALANPGVQETRHKVQYAQVGAFCEALGLPGALGEPAANLGRRLTRPGRCAIMGDLWPPSVLIAPDGLRVIDWELSHFGNPAQDLGHLAAHLWLAQLGGHPVAAELRTRFFDAYRAALGDRAPALLTDAIRRDAALHCGCEILMRLAGPFRTPPDDARAAREASRLAADLLAGRRRLALG